MADSIRSLWRQTHPPDLVVVVADNCTDGTEAVARKEGARVFRTAGNLHKKAGALNQVLQEMIPGLQDDDRVLVGAHGGVGSLRGYR